MQDMRFGVLRAKYEASSDKFTLDGEYCPHCHLPTEIAEDPTRRYCTNRQCNALIKEDLNG
jgi:ribosomal protein S27AE